MSKLVWTNGLPNEPGIYWFDTGFRDRLSEVETPMVIKVYGNGRTYAYGDYGSGPIHNFYNPKVCPKACHASIQPPGEWEGPTCIKRDGSRAWVQSPEGHVGFGLLRPWNGKAGGTVLWLNHPTSGEVHGGWMGDEYRFSPVKVPLL